MPYLLLLLMLLTGCAAQGITSSTPVDFLNAMAQSKASNCFNVAYGPGSMSGAMLGTDGAELNMTGASCTIKGKGAQ